MVVYGDFDADGICGTAILVEGLARLGGKMLSYFPHRVQEGYGLNTDSLDNLQTQGVSLVITVDCGITNNAEVAYAQAHGLDVIITDHHNVMSGLPPALATVNPKRPGSSYPFDQLAGVGVAFKLLQAVSRSLDKEAGLDEMLDLVAMGTVADKVPLLEENRYLVQRGTGGSAPDPPRRSAGNDGNSQTGPELPGHRGHLLDDGTTAERTRKARPRHHQLPPGRGHVQRRSNANWLSYWKRRTWRDRS